MIQELKKKYPSINIIKQYPESGQKHVYLVTIDGYGLIMLKIIKSMSERVMREIDIVNKNDIPNVPKIIKIDTFQYGGKEHYYFFEEYIEGQTLSEILKQKSLNLHQSLKLLERLLIIVVRLESIGIVHRDIKPDNIICTKDGDFCLIDFGIARNLNLASLTLTSVAVGPHTPGYGAPELFQYDKTKIDSRADLFSVGVVVYQSIFGKHPFITGKEADRNEIWYRTATVIPQSYLIQGDTDSQLIGLIQTLMQKHISKRPPSAKKALDWYYLVLQTLSI